LVQKLEIERVERQLVAAGPHTQGHRCKGRNRRGGEKGTSEEDITSCGGFYFLEIQCTHDLILLFLSSIYAKKAKKTSKNFSVKITSP
jgi:hypothetical protein